MSKLHGVLWLCLAVLVVERPVWGGVERVSSSSLPGSTLITFSETGRGGRLKNYLKPNPSYLIRDVEGLGDVKVRFGSQFVGQVAGKMLNSLVDTSPSSPLKLDSSAPKVGVILDSWASDKLVLGGLDLSGRRVNTTPIAVLFSTPVSWVGFDIGSFDHDGTTVVEAYDRDGKSLGTWRNQQQAGGVERVTLQDDTGAKSISGLSIYVPADGMDWEGFALDNLRFGAAPDPNVVPEPATWVVWSVLAVSGLGVQRWLRRVRVR